MNTLNNGKKEVPNQYKNIHMTNTTQDSTDQIPQVETINDDESIGTIASQDQTRLAHAMISSQQHNQETRLAHLTLTLSDKIRKVMYTHKSTSLYTIVDSGADSVVVGTGWKFLSIYPNRTVNLQGYSESETKKYNCKIGTACTVMKAIDGKEYLIMAYEAIQNRNSDISLLSEAQLRNNGIIVDSVSEKHHGLNGPGTQSIYSQDQTLQFKMQLRSAMMTLNHRLPTETEINSLPRFEITSETLWNPSSQNDDPDTINAVEDPFINHVKATSNSHQEEYDDSTILSENIGDTSLFEFEFPPEFHIPDKAQPNIDLPHDNPTHKATNSPMISEKDIIPPKVLPSYRPAARILDQFKDPNTLLHGSQQFVDINEQDVHPLDRNFYNDLKRTLNDPLSNERYANHLQSCCSTSLRPTTHTHTVSAFHTSIDDQRIIPDTDHWEDTFYDSTQDDQLLKSEQDSTNFDNFYTARQNTKPCDRVSRAFHLTIDKTNFIRENQVDTFLSDLSDRELYGYNEPVDSLHYSTDPVIQNSQIS
jgi:hypothetical protein